MDILELILRNMFIPFFVTYITTSIGYCLFVQFILYKKKCTGSWLVDGCSTVLYPYIYKNLLISFFFRYNYLMILRFFKKHEKIEQMYLDPKYSIQYKTVRYMEYDEFLNEPTTKYICNDCLEKHDAILIANLLAEEGA